MPSGLHAFGNRFVIGSAKNEDDVSAGLGGDLDLGTPGVHRFQVGDQGMVGELRTQGTNGVKAFTLDEGGAGLNPIGTSLDRLAG